MPEIKDQITTGNLIQMAVAIVPILVTAVIMYVSINAQAQVLADHEMRIRSVEKEIAVELSKINTKLGSIAKAVNE